MMVACWSVVTHQQVWALASLSWGLEILIGVHSEAFIGRQLPEQLLCGCTGISVVGARAHMAMVNPDKAWSCVGTLFHLLPVLKGGMTSLPLTDPLKWALENSKSGISVTWVTWFLMCL